MSGKSQPYQKTYEINMSAEKYWDALFTAELDTYVVDKGKFGTIEIDPTSVVDDDKQFKRTIKVVNPSIVPPFLVNMGASIQYSIDQMKPKISPGANNKKKRVAHFYVNLAGSLKDWIKVSGSMSVHEIEGKQDRCLQECMFFITTTRLPDSAATWVSKQLDESIEVSVEAVNQWARDNQ